MGKIILLASLIGITGCASTSPTPGKVDLSQSWTIEYIEERPVIDKSPAYIEFTADGRVGGNASCNRFMGGYVLSGSNLSFGKLGSTRKMCFDALMEQETRFLAALERVAKAQFREGLLILLDAKDATVIKASRREDAR